MRLIDLTNKTFNDLTVIRKTSSTRYGRVTWECLCICGNKVNITSQHLTRKKNPVKSCGCAKNRNSGKNHKDWTGYKEFSGSFWSRIKSGARKDLRPHLEFDIDLEYVYDLFKTQDGKCKYSKLPLTIPRKWDDKSYTASLDRIDSGKGYVKGNVQWVHKDVNKMKNSYSEEYFLEMCKLITEGGVCPIK